MSKPRDDRQDDLFRPPLDQIINLRHPPVRLTQELDWEFLAGRFGSTCTICPTSDCATVGSRTRTSSTSAGKSCTATSYRSKFLAHALASTPGGAAHGPPAGEPQCGAQAEAIEAKDLQRVAVDTTVQEKAIAHPTVARLVQRAIEKLAGLAKREGVELRQSYRRVARRAAIMVGRYTHAHQFKRARASSSSCARGFAGSSAGAFHAVI